MASLPLSFAPTLCWLNPKGYINVQSANSTASVVGWQDEVSALAANQLTAANCPTFAPLTGSANPGVVFGGSANLGFNSLATKVGSAWTVYLVGSVVTPAGSEQDFFTFGTSTSAADGYARLGVSGSAAVFNFQNNSAVRSAGSGGTVDTKVHLYTLSYGGGNVALFLDGVSAASASISGAITFDRCTLGALSSNGSISANLTGTICEVAVFGGARDENVESYFLYKYALNNATNKGL